MVKRGQAAMEFLMTYGWAILVVLAAIGALAYFGVLSPDNFLPQQCTVSPEFGNTCLEFQATAPTGPTTNDGSVALGLRNNVGSSIRNVSVTLSGEGWTSECDAVDFSERTFSNGARIGLNSTPTEAPLVTFENCAAVPQSGRFTADITIEYRLIDGAIEQVRTGKLQTRVVE